MIKVGLHLLSVAKAFIYIMFIYTTKSVKSENKRTYLTILKPEFLSQLSDCIKIFETNQFDEKPDVAKDFFR